MQTRREMTLTLAALAAGIPVLRASAVLADPGPSNGRPGEFTGRRRAPSPAPPPPGMRIPGRNVFAWYQTYEEVYTAYGAAAGDVNAIAANKRDIADAQGTGVDGFGLFFINRADL